METGRWRAARETFGPWLPHREGSHAVASSTGLRGFLRPTLGIYPSEHRTRSQAFLTTEPARQRREKDPRFLVH